MGQTVHVLAVQAALLQQRRCKENYLFLQSPQVCAVCRDRKVATGRKIACASQQGKSMQCKNRGMHWTHEYLHKQPRNILSSHVSSRKNRQGGHWHWIPRHPSSHGTFKKPLPNPPSDVGLGKSWYLQEHPHSKFAGLVPMSHSLEICHTHMSKKRAVTLWNVEN